VCFRCYYIEILVIFVCFGLLFVDLLSVFGRFLVMSIKDLLSKAEASPMYAGRSRYAELLPTLDILISKKNYTLPMACKFFAENGVQIDKVETLKAAYRLYKNRLSRASGTVKGQSQTPSPAAPSASPASPHVRIDDKLGSPDLDKEISRPGRKYN